MSLNNLIPKHYTALYCSYNSIQVILSITKPLLINRNIEILVNSKHLIFHLLQKFSLKSIQLSIHSGRYKDENWNFVFFVARLLIPLLFTDTHKTEFLSIHFCSISTHENFMERLMQLSWQKYRNDCHCFLFFSFKKSQLILQH